MSTTTAAGSPAMSAVRRDAARRRRHAGEPGTRLAHVIMGVGMLYFAVPLIWIVIAASKSQPDLLSSPALWFGHGFDLPANLRQLFREDDGVYGRWLVNTSSHGMVVLTIDPPSRGWVLGLPVRLRELRPSLADPEAFLAALG